MTIYSLYIFDRFSTDFSVLAIVLMLLVIDIVPVYIIKTGIA